jgi:hypothetical protein
MLALVTMLLAGQAFAQDFSSYNEERPMPRYLRYWHLLNSETANYPEISNMALQVFKKDFSNASEVHWSIVENKYMARFTYKNRLTRCLFDNKGQIVYSTSEGNEKSLPTEIRESVKSIYYDHQITFTTELHIMNKTAWIINLEDKTSLVTVKVVDGEVIEIGNFRKSK